MVSTMAPLTFAAEKCVDTADISYEYLQTLSEDLYNYLCHSDNWFIKNIVLKVIQLLCAVFGVDIACECGETHMLTTELLVTDVPDENPYPQGMPHPGMY